MKKQCIKTFKQVYKKDGETKEFTYRVGVIKDTEGYVYRIMNFDDLTIWKTYRFNTFKEAEEFLDRHPHNINRKVN